MIHRGEAHAVQRGCDAQCGTGAGDEGRGADAIPQFGQETRYSPCLALAIEH